MRLIIALSCVALAGCGSLSSNDKRILGVAAGVALLGNTPSSEIEQVYYLGVFDPQDQLQPMFYRVRVRGQSAALNTTRFASGWVRAELVDSLGTTMRFDTKSGELKFEKTDELLQAVSTGRRLVMFGPEGFREAPKDHRLVIVMGASPENFFQAVDEALGTIASATQGVGVGDLDRTLLGQLLQLRTYKERLGDFAGDLKADDTTIGGTR